MRNVSRPVSNGLKNWAKLVGLTNDEANNKTEFIAFANNVRSNLNSLLESIKNKAGIEHTHDLSDYATKSDVAEKVGKNDLAAYAPAKTVIVMDKKIKDLENTITNLKSEISALSNKVKELETK